MIIMAISQEETHIIAIFFCQDNHGKINPVQQQARSVSVIWETLTQQYNVWQRQ